MQKENEYLHSQVFSLKRQLENVEFSYESKDLYEPKLREERDVVYRRDYSPEDVRSDYKKDPKSKKVESQNRDQTPEEINPRRKTNKPQPVVSFDTRKEDRKKEYMPVRTINNTSNNVTEVLNWKSGPPKMEFNPNVLENLQNKLNDLNLENNRLENELERIKESKHPNSLKRKGEIELERSICQSNINSVTSKLRKLSWLANS